MSVSAGRITATDEAFMRAALAFARRGLGRTAPMPGVAALVVDEAHDPPRMIARGATAPHGRPHAEDFALRDAGAAARGATLYVTLEPCANRSQRYFGPSCTERILESGIARVVIAAADPSPFAAGEGAKRLRAAGVIVVEGVLAAEAARLHQGHCQRVRLNRPFVRVKLAATADGYAGTPERGPLRITGDDARARVHRLRADVDALLTGIGTVLADDPMLDVRLPGMADFSPLRVILDTEGRLPPTARLVADAHRVPVLVATAEPEALRARLGSVEGLEVIAIPRAGEAGENGGLDLAAVFGALAARGITRVMVEAGPRLADAVAAAGFCDELALFESDTPAGRGIAAIGPALADWVAKADLHGDTRIGPDRLRIFLKGD